MIILDHNIPLNQTELLRRREALNKDLLRTSHEQMTRYQLLPADSIDAVLIQRRHLPAVATRDDDFDRVENLDVYKP